LAGLHATRQRAFAPHSIEWMTMRIQDGRVHSLDTGDVLEVSNDLLVDAGDAAVIPSDLLRTLQVCSEAVAAALRRGRVPVVLGGGDSLLFACVRGLHEAVPGTIGLIHFAAQLDLMDEKERQGRFSRRAVPEHRVQPQPEGRRRSGATPARPRLGLTARDLAERGSVVARLGTPDDMCQQLLKRRERLGLSYILVSDELMEAFAPVVEHHQGA
jgi:arginase family enzyme